MMDIDIEDDCKQATDHPAGGNFMPGRRFDMPEERYLKEIASELRLIRKELQRMNNPPEFPFQNAKTINIDALNINRLNYNDAH